MKTGIGPQNLGAPGMNPKSTPCGHSTSPANYGDSPMAFVDPYQQPAVMQPQMGMQQAAMPQMGAMPQQPGQTPLYNAGTMYLKKEAAKAAGKDTFQVGDKTFPVKG
jgi:hypothetical protein